MTKEMLTDELYLNGFAARRAAELVLCSVFYSNRTIAQRGLSKIKSHSLELLISCHIRNASRTFPCDYHLEQILA